MTLRFEVNQAESFRRGIDVDKSTNHLKIDPNKLSQEDRNLIADHLVGIDVVQKKDKTKRIIAITPSFESLMEAIRKDESELA